MTSKQYFPMSNLNLSSPILKLESPPPPVFNLNLPIPTFKLNLPTFNVPNLNNSKDLPKDSSNKPLSDKKNNDSKETKTVILNNPIASHTETWTITFSECVENHAGMQQYGTKSERGFTASEINEAGKIADSLGFRVEYHDLSELLPENKRKEFPKEIESSQIVIIREGCKLFSDEGSSLKKYGPTGGNVEKLINEIKMTADIVDKQALMRGRVVNKLARWNLCFADHHQVADIENGKGTIKPFSEMPNLAIVRNKLPLLLGNPAKNLFAELNYYYNVKKCGIGYHGDSERRFVIALRFGASLPLHYQWYHESKPVGRNLKLMLNNCDLYIMGEKAAGTDWKRRKVPTLRHSAGCDKYVNVKAKSEK